MGAMRSTTALAFAILTTACGSDGPLPCKLDGSYRIVAHESMGNCGPLPDQMQSTSDRDNCMTGSFSAGPDGDQECVVTYARTCRTPDGSKAILGVSVQREEDDSTWTGAGDVRIWDPSGAVVCHSLYFLTFIRQ